MFIDLYAYILAVAFAVSTATIDISTFKLLIYIPKIKVEFKKTLSLKDY